MKKLFYILAVLSAVVLVLAACGKTENPEALGDDMVLIDKVENLEKYVFVDMQSTSSNASAVMADIRGAVKAATGLTLKMAAAYQKNDYEILVGVTNRQESLDAINGLKYFDYRIKMVNNKIVIAAGSDEALLRAAELFKSEFLYPEGKSLYLPADYTYKYKYPIDKLTVDGIDISEFKILNQSYLTEEEIETAFLSAFEFDLPIVEEAVEGEHYIILDASSYSYEDYSISVEAGNIRIRGSYSSIGEALGVFTDEFLKGLGKAEYDLTSADRLEGEIEKPEIYTKDQLMTVLTRVYEDKDHIIIGEQSRGNNASCVTDAIKTFEKATAEKPGIIGIELQTFGMGIFSHTDPKALSRIICDIVDYTADGGIVTFSAHWENPSGNYPDEDNLYRGVLGYDYTKAGYEKAFTDLLTEGTEYNTKWMSEIDREVEFFLALKDNDVPAIWRPLHETNGNWFWFCTTQAGITLDASYIKNIWYYIYDYFAEKGIDNLLWCYAPSPSSNVENDPGSTMSAMYLYPGDEYCDLVGVDWYTQGDLEITNNDPYLRLVDETRKIGALTEFGVSGKAANEEGRADPEYYSSMNAYRDLLSLRGEGYSFAYLMTWGGSWSFMLMGEGEKFMAQEMTLGQTDVKAIFDTLK